MFQILNLSFIYETPLFKKDLYAKVNKCLKNFNCFRNLMAYKTQDRVEVKSAKGTHAGIIMPSNNKEFLTLKLDNGYNISLEKKGLKIKKIKAKFKKEKPLKIKIPKKNLPSVSLITTGGTITSRIDYKTGAVHPLEKPEELLLSIPELVDVVNINRIHQPFAVLSEDITPVEWQKIAKLVAKELNSNNVGVIITHGTDTLHYTAAALSFMLKNLSKPVALVGGQRSSDRGSFDGAINLICAANYCKSDIAEVAVVMHGEEQDSFCLANRGVKTRKMSTSRRDTFRPINELPLARISKDGSLSVLNTTHRKRTDEKVIADTKFESKIAMLKFYPGASPDFLKHCIDHKYKGVIIEATGFGHVAVQTLNKSDSWLPAIKEAIEKGIFIGFAPQAIYGRLNPNVYSNARILQEAGVVFLEDMLPETAYVKLGWVLGHTTNHDKAKEMMLTNIAGEINKRIPSKVFLY